jgi:hypothetical protein
MKKHTYLLILTFFGLSINLTAQNNTVSAGGDAEGSNGSISFTVGQVVYTSAEGSNGSINQGVQQPYDLEIITGILCIKYPYIPIIKPDMIPKITDVMEIVSAFFIL